MEQKTPKKTGQFQRILSLTLIVLGLLCILLYLLSANGVWPFAPRLIPEESPVISAPATPEALPSLDLTDGYQYPTDKLFIAEDRTRYQDEEITLKIPSLGITASVYDGVDDDVLKKGPGLYDYSPLPGTGNPNVSIAGHRDIHGSVFYYVDYLSKGDLLYLVFGGKIYTYKYVETTVVEPDDWGPIYCVDYSALTLTSCTPIGTSKQRIIIRAELVDIADESADFSFTAHAAQ